MKQPGIGRRTGASTVLVFLVLAVMLARPGSGNHAGVQVEAVNPQPVAELAALEGTIAVLPAGSSLWQDAAPGDLLYHGDRARTGPGAWALLRLAGGGSMTLGPDCEVAFDSLMRLRLFIGRIWAKVKPALPGAAGFEVETPSAVVGVRGTHFSVFVDAEITTVVSVAEGIVEVLGARKAVMVPGGYATRVRRGHEPVQPVPMDEDEKRAWAKGRGRPGDDGDDDDDGSDDDDDSHGKHGPGSGGPSRHGRHSGNS